MLQRRLFCVALLAAALGRPRPALAREVQETYIDSWQSVVRIADFAFIPPADDNEDVSLTPGFDAVNHAKEGPRKKARETYNRYGCGYPMPLSSIRAAATTSPRPYRRTTAPARILPTVNTPRMSRTLSRRHRQRAVARKSS